MSECPVVTTIREIRGGGLYLDEESETNVIRLGGGETEFICDSVSFYIMSRKMELARFKLSNPTPDLIAAKVNKMFGDIIGMDYTALYSHIIKKYVAKNGYLYNQFVQLIDLIGTMEELILAKVESAGRKQIPINISIPDIFLSPNVDQLILYRPDILHHVVNQIIDYVNLLNVNSILSTPRRTTVSHVAPFSALVPSMATLVVCNPTYNFTDIRNLDILLQHEMVVAEYVREVEKYHCMVINHMNLVYSICKDIVEQLVKN